MDNLVEKVDKCPLNRGRCILLVYNWDRENCPLYGVAGYPLFRGCLSIEVNGRTVGTLRIVHYIVDVRFSGVSVKRGSTVALLLCNESMKKHESAFLVPHFLLPSSQAASPISVI